jgi:hypothetical protein
MIYDFGQGFVQAFCDYFQCPWFIFSDMASQSGLSGNGGITKEKVVLFPELQIRKSPSEIISMPINILALPIFATVTLLVVSRTLFGNPIWTMDTGIDSGRYLPQLSILYLLVIVAGTGLPQV